MGADPRQVQPDSGTAEPDYHDDDQSALWLSPRSAAFKRGTLPGDRRVAKLHPHGSLYAREHPREGEHLG